MQRFKAWLFLWLMGEHFAEIERRLADLEKRDQAVFAFACNSESGIDKRLTKLTERLDHISSQPKATPAPRATHSFAEFQRLTATDDQEVQ